MADSKISELEVAEVLATDLLPVARGDDNFAVTADTIADLVRDDLASSASAKGASLVSLENGQTVQEAIDAFGEEGGAALIGTIGGGNVQSDLNARVTTANLASTATGKGAALVKWKAPVTGAVDRTIEDELQDASPSIRATGATGLNSAGDAAAIDTLLANVTPGQRIRGPRTTAAAAAFKKQDGTFTIARSVDFDFEGGVDLRIDQTAGVRNNVLTVNVLRATGEISDSAVGEWRGGHFRGGRIFTNALTGAQTASGAYGIDVHQGTSKSIVGLTIEKQVISGGTGAVRFSSTLNRTGSGNETQWCQIVRCTLEGTTRFESEDGTIAVDCIATGRASGAPAYEWDMTEGAFCSGVFRGTTAGIGGAAQIKNGSFIKLHNVQMEHAGTSATGLAGGAQITILGTDYKSQAVEIIGCNLGAGAYVTNTINLYNAAGTIIDRTQFNIAGGGSSADLLLNRDGTDAAKDTDNTVVGYTNTWRGARSVQPAGAMTDVSRRMIISHVGGDLRKQHRGIWFPVLGLLSSPVSGLGQSGLECMVDHSGAIRFNGYFTRAAFFGDGTVVGTFPSWLRPHAIHRFPIIGAAGAQAVGVILSNGIFAVEGAGLAASTELWIPNGAWNVIVNPDYVTVP